MFCDNLFAISHDTCPRSIFITFSMSGICDPETARLVSSAQSLALQNFKQFGRSFM